MSSEEKSVIDDFEGQKSYNETIQKTHYYLEDFNSEKIF